MKQLLINEETFIGLVAQSALDQHMIEWLSVYMLRTFPADEQDKWLDALHTSLAGKIGLPPTTTEHQAVLLSEIAVQAQERGYSLVRRLREHMRADLEWLGAEERAAGSSCCKTE